MTVLIADLFQVYNFCLINMYITVLHTVRMHTFLFQCFFHDFGKLSVKLFKSATVNLGDAKMEGPYILYRQVLLFVKI
jgi:hypothetical protein